MADYEIPQFIGRENKLLGPLTVRQVLIMTVFIIALIVLYFTVGVNDRILFFMLAVVVITSCILVVFVKYNGRPISLFLSSLFNSIFSPRVYKWRKVNKDAYGKRIGVIAEKPEIELTEYKIDRLAQFLNNSED